ncbi:unnamed protein product [Effrenium voratum]|uniref:Uncharacterized protein n=1 Tax=Effrenium voratum TaxID=2562239 RepID=A0AA36I8S1_9DINO|nr:unnamed protein product [Effrenium voratum]CAJ1442566.1 unnamed protein product [Effrenium voratum]
MAASLGDIWIQVAQFMGRREIGCCDAAAVFARAQANFLWHSAAMSVLAESPIWSRSGEGVVEQLLEQGTRGKHFLRELQLLRRAMFPPKVWAPAIVETSFCSFQAVPVEDGESVPNEVAIPLTIGATSKQTLAVGLELVTDGTAESVASAVCIGVEVCAPRDDGRVISLMFAPMSGQCYMQYLDSQCIVSTSVLPPVPEPVDGPISVWAKVAEDGGIFFLRQIPGCTVEESGKLPRKALPLWAAEFFVCVYLWMDYLKTPVSISVPYSAKKLPISLELAFPQREIESTWHLHQ